MRYKVKVSDNFKKESKRLSKKYKSLKFELKQLFEELSVTPTKGTHLGNNIYKIRLSIHSKGKGKSGGARILSLVQSVNNEVILFSIYNKGERDSVSDKEIKQLIKNL